MIISSAILFTSCNSVNNAVATADETIIIPAKTSAANEKGLSSPKYNVNGNINTDIKLDNLNLYNSENIYDSIPNASFNVYELKKDSEQLIHQIRYLRDEFIIESYENNEKTKTVAYNSGIKIIRIVNDRTNTSIDISAEDYINNTKNNLYPYSFFIPEYYGLKGSNTYKRVGNDIVDDERCIVYDVFNADSVPVKRIYISEANNLIVRCDDLITNVSTIIKNLEVGKVTRDLFIDFFDKPVMTQDKNVPIEGDIRYPKGFFDTAD